MTGEFRFITTAQSAKARLICILRSTFSTSESLSANVGKVGEGGNVGIFCFYCVILNNK